MGVFSKPDSPDPVPPPAPVEPIPTEVDEEVKSARTNRRRQAALAQGRSSTILTSPQGVLDQNTSGKSLLGT